MPLHTPGPWRVKGDRVESTDDVICKVISDTGGADARLIAAAPEMYTACSEALRMLHSHNRDSWYEAEVLLSDAITAAVIGDVRRLS